MPDQLWWFLTRASGIVTLAASGGAVIWGLLLSTRIIQRRSLPKWLLDLHRYLGAVTIASLAVHIAALIADSYVEFGVADVAVPFRSEWRPAAVAWGIFAAYLLVAVEATSLARRRVPKRLWAWVHTSSFAAFGLSLGHAATAGTDNANRAYLLLAAALTLTIVFLGIYRMLHRWSPPSRHDQRAAPHRPAVTDAAS